MADAAAPPRFVADRTLGRLARWLRILGYDVAYGSNLAGRTAATRARREGRILLTRDTRLRRDPALPPAVFIRSDRFRDQLREVAAAVPLRGARAFGRCLDCNRPLVEVAREEARDRVPPYVWETQSRFRGCPGCGRLYWDATHRRSMLGELISLGLAPEAAAEP